RRRRRARGARWRAALRGLADRGAPRPRPPRLGGDGRVVRGGRGGLRPPARPLHPRRHPRELAARADRGGRGDRRRVGQPAAAVRDRAAGALLPAPDARPPRPADPDRDPVALPVQGPGGVVVGACAGRRPRRPRVGVPHPAAREPEDRRADRVLRREGRRPRRRGAPGAAADEVLLTRGRSVTPGGGRRQGRMTTAATQPVAASAGERGASTPIGEYGLLADCNSAALVSRDGSIDWLCLPRYDSAAVLARLLDPDAGHWSLRPAGAFTAERRYLSGTLVIETIFRTESGTARLRDAMAFADGQRGHALGYDAPHEILRSVEGVSGEVTFVMELAPRPDYGLIRPLIRLEPGGARTFGAGRVGVTSPVALEVEDST